MDPKGRSVLVLGGTSEGRTIATILASRPGLRVVTSLAGRVADPTLPPGEVRIGGFGGPAGLAAWLAAEGIDAVVDATHPFAAGITASAVAAASQAGVPLIRLDRPGWTEAAGDTWIRVPTLAAAADALAGLGERVFLTTGRQGLSTFASLHGHWFLVRSVNAPDPPLPARMRLVLDRGPFTVEGELALMRSAAVDVVVTKDSGGELAAAKLTAARELGLPVVMVDRPATPSCVEVVTGVEAAVVWVEELMPGSVGE
jgi:precorrin-6A/cobalt-precorrin-6A reductase